MKKIITISLVAIVAGCANTDALEQEVASLTNKVSVLSNDVAELKEAQMANKKSLAAVEEAAEQASSDASQANEKVDNMVATFKK